jgi:serine/threonine protein kinase
MTSTPTCPSDEELLAIVAGEEPAEGLRHHLDGCPECSERLRLRRAEVAEIRRAMMMAAASDPGAAGASTDPATANGRPVQVETTEPWDSGRSGECGPPSSLEDDGMGCEYAPLDAPPSPAAIGKYLVIGRFPRAGQAEVYRIMHPGVARDLVLKLSLAPIEPGVRHSIIEEGKILAGLKHPHLVEVYDVGLHEERHYVVMECLRGRTLAQVAREGNMTPRQASALLLKVAGAVDYVHRHGIIHGDIKPESIIVDEAGEPRLNDLGMARMRHAWCRDPGRDGGTFAFMAPEQARVKSPQDQAKVGPRSDVFALGAVLYYLLTGKPPFMGQTHQECWDRTRRGDFDRRALEAPAIPGDLRRVCLQAMAEAPADRYPSAEALYRALNGCGWGQEAAMTTEAYGSSAEPMTRSRPESSILGDRERTAELEPLFTILRHGDRSRWSEVVGRLRSGGRKPDPARLARELESWGLITAYQAAAIGQGKIQGLFIGPYVVLDKIGSGAMGRVFKAFHRDHGTVVALKIMPPSFSRRDPAVVERFRREAEALARLQHPNIVCCYDGVRECNGVYYLAMEYVEGRDLRVRVQEMGVLKVSEAINCLLQAARGLQAAHSRGIFHRDVKPANVMLDREGTARILDFGLARVTSDDPWILDHSDGTATGTILGTIPYMAPEQARDARNADARSDIYSLGCTLHYLLTGRPPYGGRTWSEMFLAHLDSPIPSLREARPSVPDHLEDLFVRMLAKDPDDRPPTMASVIASIELAMEESRKRPPSSQTIVVYPREDPVIEPMVSRDTLKILHKFERRPKKIYYTGRRLRPPEGPVDLAPLLRYSLLAIVTTLAVILVLEIIY